MGGGKPLLVLGGQTLIARCLRTLLDASVQPRVVVLGHNAGAVLRAVQLEDSIVIVNRRFREGLSTSVATGLRVLPPETEAALMVPVDQPFVTPALLRQLIEAHHRTAKPIVVPTFRGRRSTPVLLGRSLFREADRLRGDAGFRALFPRHARDIEEVPVNDARILMDIDTPRQYERAVRMERS